MEFFAGGTVAKFAAAGHEVTLVCATDNDKGSFELSADELRAVRDKELNGAARGPGHQARDPAGLLRRRPRVRCLTPRAARRVHAHHPRGEAGHRHHVGSVRAVRGSSRPPRGRDSRQRSVALQPLPELLPGAARGRPASRTTSASTGTSRSRRETRTSTSTSTPSSRRRSRRCTSTRRKWCSRSPTCSIGLRASGLDVPWLASLDPHDYHAVIDKQIRAGAASRGPPVRARCQYAEGFRRTRYNGIESLAKDQQIAEDV